VTTKPLNEFPRNRSDSTGFASYCKPCHNARGRENRIKNHGSTRRYHLKARYGIDQIDVDRMLMAQAGGCAVCGRPDPEHVDHDHKTGVVRGMLCFNCNQALGNVRDSVAVLRGLQDYLLATKPPMSRFACTEYRFRGEVIELAPDYRHHAVA
jgi:hypothetical protein